VLSTVLAVGNPTLDLPAAQSEAEAVASLFPSSTLVLGESGTESRVREELAKGYDVVHIASHGEFSAGAPLLSGIRLHSDAAGSQETATFGFEDGFLCAGEILSMSLYSTQLATLSACETALPAVELDATPLVGDEIQGLASALWVAGVPSALLTLWNLSDASTMEWMVSFYKSLVSGAGIGAALAEAQQEMLKTEAYRHPYYWAPFILYGLW
jgi:CHAT domain-containing protein